MTERRSRRPQRRRLAVAVLGGAVLFALGVAVGEALHDNPRPGGTQTRVRTLKPVALPPARVTVTVTTSP
ncbi:MAG TPA: hypothetical protein VLN26_15210 [Gaiellaceae bacterium]|nr:hypothetical protein [Gaiellaceae bacterium]